MKKILVSLSLNEIQKKKLEFAADGRAGFCYIPGEYITEADMQDVNGVIGNISPSLLACAPHLEWVQLNSAGQDKYEKEGVLPKGCILKNAVGTYGLTVSEHMLALTLSLVRKLELYAINQTKHVWQDEGSVTSIEGATVIVLGLGDIGGSYARKMKALGAYVIGVRASKKPKPDYLDEQYTIDELDRILPCGDIVAAALPSAPQTVHLMNAQRFALFKKGAYFINCGRGDLVDQEALREAILQKRLAGAALDVTVPEPLPAEDALWSLPNVILTPHVAGGFHLQQTFERIVDLAAAHLDEYLTNA